ncbi:alpha/beta fold hydrolase [Dyella sp. GSA-30]|uniref:alpha/beta hydrolase family protein n=1 Tax=Dyella sp. GSA-30 TaxID=2994496 RepID=UPI0031F33097
MQPADSDTPIHETGLPVTAADGATTQLLWRAPKMPAHEVLYWMPALGVAAKHYLPLADALAARGIAVAIHEWRGIGSSNRRAGRQTDWAYRQLLELDMPAGIATARSQWPDARYWIGGHSLGGQLATVYGALHPQAFSGLALVASGAPYWRRFPRSWLIGLAYVAAPWLARLVGHLPGRRIGFGGNEARGVIDDWARTGRTGRYAARDMADDMEAKLAALHWPILTQRMHDDWLVPETSLDWLLGKMPLASRRSYVLASSELGHVRADHFSWMKAPGAIAGHIADWIDSGT